MLSSGCPSLQLAALDKIENSRTPQPLEEIKKLRDKPDVEARIAELVVGRPRSHALPADPQPPAILSTPPSPSRSRAALLFLPLRCPIPPFLFRSSFPCLYPPQTCFFHLKRPPAARIFSASWQSPPCFAFAVYGPP